MTLSERLAELSEGEKGWIAGIIDGEGYIRLHRPRKAYPRDDGSHMKNAGDAIQVSVANTDPRMLMKLQDLAGGSIRPRQGTKKAAWVWRVTSGAAGALLPVILPYMVSKREQAELAMEFLDGRPFLPIGIRMSSEEDERRERIYQRMQYLRQFDFRISA